jgi:hypothetical protein
MRTTYAFYILFLISLGPLPWTGCASSVPSDPSPSGNPWMSADMGRMPPTVGGHSTADMAGAPVCTTAPQSGCPDGFKCTSYDYATTTCDVAGQAARGTSCNQVPDSCQAGLLCVDESFGAGSPTQCRQFCAANSDCGTGSYCEIPLHGGLALCTQACDPTASATCEAGLGCYLYGAEHSDCVKAGSVAAGGKCASFSDCQPGLFCSVSGGSGHCYPVCRRANQGACGSGSTCTIIRDNTYQWQTYGVCCPVAGC